MRLFRFELRKLFLRAPVFIALAVFTVLDLAKICAVADDASLLRTDEVWARVYREQYGNYSGEITLDKINTLLDLYKPLEWITNDITATTRSDVEGTLTGNYYSDRNLLARYFVSPMRRFYNCRGDAETVVRLARDNEALYTRLGCGYEARMNAAVARIYSGRAVTEFRYTEGYRLLLTYDFSAVLALLILLYALCQTFARDRECRMDELMLATPGGGAASVLAKLAAATVFTLAVPLWFSTVDYLGFELVLNLSEANGLPVYAEGTMAASSVGMTLLGFYTVSALTRALGFWALGMMFLLISEAGRHALLPFAAGAAAFILCTAAGVRWGYSSEALFKAVNPYCVIINRLLFGRTEFINVLGVPVLTWQAALVMSVLLGLTAAALALFLGGRNNIRKGVLA